MPCSRTWPRFATCCTRVGPEVDQRALQGTTAAPMPACYRSRERAFRTSSVPQLSLSNDFDVEGRRAQLLPQRQPKRYVAFRRARRGDVAEIDRVGPAERP